MAFKMKGFPYSGKSPFTMPGSEHFGRGNQSVAPGKYTASPAKKGKKKDEEEA